MENVLKVSVVGEAGVGKSAMIVRLLTGRFLQHYDPTLEDEYYTTIKTRQGEKEIAILDTAGQESEQLDYYIHSSDVLLVAFSVEDRGSFQHAKHIISTAVDRHTPVILVGTKMDLRASERTVSEEEALSVANDLCCPYKEISAACDQNVELVFQIAVNLVMTKIRKVQDTHCLELEKKEEKSKPIKGVLKRWKSIRLRKTDTQTKISKTHIFVSTL